jgi:hypothetical protein
MLMFFFACCAVSCKKSHPDGSLANALDFAGENRKQLEQVLDYYAKPADSLKLKAAEFLISNMPEHYGRKNNNASDIFSVLDTVSYYRNSLSNDEKIRIVDSLIRLNGSVNAAYADNSDSTIINDANIINANYLISNIEFAFRAWQKAPWGKKVSFQDFCEYILPYRIRNEQIQSWRPGFYQKYYTQAVKIEAKDLKAVFSQMKSNTEGETSLSAIFNDHYPLEQNIGDIAKGKIGACETVCFYAVEAMRSAGLPVALDYIPHWGNINSSYHHISHLVDHSTRPSLLNNDNNNIYLNTWGIVDFSSDFNGNHHVFTVADMPSGLYVQHIKTIPKVYRYMYSANAELRDINLSVPGQYVAPFFKKLNLRDVTEDYVKTGFVHIDIKPEFSKYKVVYLCTFNTVGWQAVALNKIINNTAVFKKVGFNVMYLPAVYDSGRYIPINKPFWVDSLNGIRSYGATGHKLKSINIQRKFPLFSYTAYHTEALKGGRFEASDLSDFSKSELLYEIKNYPFYMNEVSVNPTKSYRYLRYVSPIQSMEADNIAEIQFYSDNTYLKGTPMGVAGSNDHGIEKAFDNKIDTYYQNAMNSGGWLGIDIGSINNKRVTKIKFCPTNDSNCIMPQNEYELFYWNNNKWISLGTKNATTFNLTYKQVPDNCLYWLKCKSGGKEERIFTMEGDKQIWW